MTNKDKIIDIIFKTIAQMDMQSGPMKNQAGYEQFLLSKRTLEDLEYMRDHPSHFSAGTCNIWDINESERQDAILNVIDILERKNESK